MTDPLLFCLAVLAVLGTPGPTNTLLATSGAAAGFRRSLVMVPAELAGYLGAILIIALVIGPVVWSQPALSAVLRFCVAVYLAVLAVRLWRNGIVEVSTHRGVVPRDVLVTTFLNPKAAIFALVVIPMHAPGWPRYLAAFCVLLVCMSLTWITVGVALSRGLLPVNGRRFIYRVGAAVTAGFAVFVTWPILKMVVAA